ncbi:MAG: hypothetical protein GY816_00895 [Cytophagales bacterium]|nr:hypothetical protein [Cytophagales bacterium]
MSEFDYKFKEYEEIVKKIEDATRIVLKYRKGDQKHGAQNLKEKLGDKLNMATVILSVTNVCLEAKDLLSKMHGHNFLTLNCGEKLLTCQVLQ